MIRATDRVSAVLGRDERLVEVFASASPVFERLRRPAMRRVMAGLVTVEQAARVAGLEPAALLERLNRALSHPDPDPDAMPSPTPAPAPAADTAPPALPPELVVDLDVRDDLRQGKEPFARIMAARKALPPGGALRLRATFEPVPLYAVMARQGYGHWTERLADDDWRVTFHPAPAAEPAAAPAPPVDGGGDEGVVVLDVRGLEPPEPMVRTLAALETLPPGGTLVQVNVRVPQFLLPKLEELGFTHRVHEPEDGGPVRVFIRRRESR